MKRASNDPQEEVTLYVGLARLVALGQNKKIEYAQRTVTIT